MFNEIPVMDDPLGKYWVQPPYIRLALMDEKHIILTSSEVAKLPRYNTSIPTGVYPGKCWLRREEGRVMLVWYGEETPEHNCPILFRDVIVLEGL
jgi:hypothetical protein